MALLRGKESYLLLITTLMLSIIGIIFVYSAGTYWSAIHYSEKMPFYMKQSVYFVVAIVVFFVTIRLDALKTKSFWKMAYVFSLILLVLVLIPGIGLVRNGSQSWIGLGPLTIQPAELVKITVIVYMSHILAEHKTGKPIVNWRHGAILLLPIVLIMLQPDFGSVFILVVSVFLLFFVAGYPLKLYGLFIVVGIAGLATLIATAPYRLKRIEAFLDPWVDPLGSGFQAVQSLMAIGPAGIFGHGFGQSRQKFLYLPEPQNDFIFAIILEEVGLVGGLAIVALFVLVLYAGYKLAVQAKTRTAFYAIIGLVTMLSVQAFLNIAVVIGLVPVTGVTLPFISYGGTSLVTMWLIIGIIYQLAK
ncbi:cell division protein FtsW [Lysinibacillus contaminans]|uniref:Cell division protein FtsW n=1 Tax=Lysinibacillus contaminans TaxID=1293441 RepID=A0ABR5K3S5_9BACI|nr:putative lipid II flippase FtsW [Lysinibacillus contaminans]KOS69573.1 cell division protein FtsW [Lysinibacillus contaminans]